MAMIPRMMPNKIYLDDVFDDFFFPTTKENNFGKMRCDIYEKDNTYYLEMDIPGFTKEDINIEIDDNDYLTITAEKNVENTEEDENKNYIRKERNYGKYQRSFYIGGIDKERIDANFENGILNIIMPKKEEEKSSKQTIEIK
ncbi:MAG: Hsp20/alpha crystallin family protein [Bacilli bacterium]|nr:Hsp20/alpha crystallin family protein [Bacilli bacterium]